LQTAHAPGMTLLRHAAPELVHAAESKLRGEAPDPSIFSRAMQGLTLLPDGDRLDVTALGCTHFPLVQDELSAACPRMRFVDGSAGIARRIRYLTAGQEWPAESSEGVFVTTGSLADVEGLQTALHSYGLTQIKSL
jgi:glutamate racemase